MDSGEDLEQDLLYNPAADQMQSQAPLKQSGLGITSFIWGFVNATLMFLLFGGMMLALLINPTLNTNNPLLMLAGILLIGGLGACLMAILLGLVGLWQRDRRQVFTVAGLLMNLFVLLGTTLVIVFGLSRRH